MILTIDRRKVIAGLKSGIFFLCLSIDLSSASLVISNSIFAEQIAEDGQFETYFHTGMILHQLPILTIGVIIYYVVKKIKAGQLNGWKVFVKSGAITVLISVIFLMLHMNKKYMTSSLIAGLMFGCLFLFCGCINSEIWKNRAFTPIEYIGKHRYGIYCFHQIVINCVLMLSFKNSNLFLWLATFVLIVVISSGVGIGAELIEGRIRFRLRNYGNRA